MVWIILAHLLTGFFGLLFAVLGTALLIAIHNGSEDADAFNIVCIALCYAFTVPLLLYTVIG